MSALDFKPLISFTQDYYEENTEEFFQFIWKTGVGCRGKSVWINASTNVIGKIISFLDDRTDYYSMSLLDKRTHAILPLYFDFSREGGSFLYSILINEYFASGYEIRPINFRLKQKSKIDFLRRNQSITGGLFLATFCKIFVSMHNWGNFELTSQHIIIKHFFKYINLLSDKQFICILKKISRNISYDLFVSTIRKKYNYELGEEMYHKVMTILYEIDNEKSIDLIFNLLGKLGDTNLGFKANNDSDGNLSNSTENISCNGDMKGFILF